ncbi:AEC family transporter [Candidatus Gracilibacteria bacterium]|nr:AEC family transporter [Candidatus Gracilibacteria bacterium]NJM88009.1 AEC family transporter [Hydrococcus sp. RU_2_2]
MWIIVNSILWTMLGMLLIRLRFMPRFFPQLLGKSLYWIGVPLQIFVLGHQSDFSNTVWLPSAITVAVLFLGWGLAVLCWRREQEGFEDELVIISGQLGKAHATRLPKETQRQLPWITELLPQFMSRYRSRQGSFILASMLGNTGFIGLAVVPALVSKSYWSWIVLYGLTHNILGSYGLGTILASHFSSSNRKDEWWMALRNVLCVPALWAFVIGWHSQDVQFPIIVENGLNISVLLVVPAAFVLIGMQLSQLQGFQNLDRAIAPTVLKIVVLPGLTGLACTLLGIQGDARLVLTIMSGMPTAFANAILAEEYNLDRTIAASSIFLSTVMLPLTIPLWLTIL